MAIRFAPRLEHLPDGPVPELRMFVGLGVSHAPVSSQAFSSSKLFARALGVKKRSRIKPTWFSTCPFSQPEAGVQAVGSTK